jgi:hypothetical protein
MREETPKVESKTERRGELVRCRKEKHREEERKNEAGKVFLLADNLSLFTLQNNVFFILFYFLFYKKRNLAGVMWHSNHTP